MNGNSRQELRRCARPRLRAQPPTVWHRARKTVPGSSWVRWHQGIGFAVPQGCCGVQMSQGDSEIGRQTEVVSSSTMQIGIYILVQITEGKILDGNMSKLTALALECCDCDLSAPYFPHIPNHH